MFQNLFSVKPRLRGFFLPLKLRRLCASWARVPIESYAHTPRPWRWQLGHAPTCGLQKGQPHGPSHRSMHASGHQGTEHFSWLSHRFLRAFLSCMLTARWPAVSHCAWLPPTSTAFAAAAPCLGGDCVAPPQCHRAFGLTVSALRGVDDDGDGDDRWRWRRWPVVTILTMVMADAASPT